MASYNKKQGKGINEDKKYVEKMCVCVAANPTRFSIQDWNQHMKQSCRLAEDQFELAERITKESERMKEIAKETILENRKETDYRLEERIKNIQFELSEVEKTRELSHVELEAQAATKQRMIDCVQYVEETAKTAVQKCLKLREGRLGIDLVHDHVEDELKKEELTIQGVIELLNKTLEQINEQMRQLRAFLYQLNKDAMEKLQTVNIERDTLNMSETNMDLSAYHGTEPLDVGNVSLHEWQQYSHDTIEKTYKHINICRMFRIHVSNLLQQITDDLRQQQDNTNEAFRRRIEEIREAKTKLEQRHFEIIRQANEMSRNVTALQVAIGEKDGFLALAQTRLGKRAQRPKVELTKDAVESRLVHEILEVRDNVAKLQTMLTESEANLRHLLKIQVQLEEDINIKTNSLKIDEVDCLVVRQKIHFEYY